MMMLIDNWENIFSLFKKHIIVNVFILIFISFKELINQLINIQQSNLTLNQHIELMLIIKQEAIIQQIQNSIEPNEKRCYSI